MLETLFDYAQFGVAIFSIGAMVFVIVKFLEFMKAQETNFRNTIDNHLKEQAKASNELANVIRELLFFLRWQNRNNKK